MCGIFGAACGNASRASHCLSLRSFAFLWLAISIIITVFQLAVGSFLSGYLSPVDTLLKGLREKIMDMENPEQVLKYYEIIANSLGTLWQGSSFLTTVRGVYDLIALIFWVVGWYKGKMVFVYIFIGMTAVDFFIDFILFFSFTIVLNAFYVAYFYPIALVIPFFLYGWQMLLGPYIIHLLLSHAYVLKEGGNGTEMKNWEEIRDMRAKAATDARVVDAEKAVLLGDETAENVEVEEEPSAYMTAPVEEKKA